MTTTKKPDPVQIAVTLAQCYAGLTEDLLDILETHLGRAEETKTALSPEVMEVLKSVLSCVTKRREVFSEAINNLDQAAGGEDE